MSTYLPNSSPYIVSQMRLIERLDTKLRNLDLLALIGVVSISTGFSKSSPINRFVRHRRIIVDTNGERKNRCLVRWVVEERSCTKKQISCGNYKRRDQSKYSWKDWTFRRLKIKTWQNQTWISFLCVRFYTVKGSFVLVIGPSLSSRMMKWYFQEKWNGGPI